MRILLIGNYLPDRQQSMIRYADLMHDGLLEVGHDVTLVVPTTVLNTVSRREESRAKWTGYLDKYLLGLGEMRRHAAMADIVHICDHSNAVYVPTAGVVPYVVTCHDLLAVRGALGEDTDCPASFSGKILQRHILRGLGRSQAVACVSGATLRDAERLLPHGKARLSVIPNALNYPYRQLEAWESKSRLAEIPALNASVPYVLNIGSNLRRKNREALLHAVAAIREVWPGQVVMAGAPLTTPLRELASRLGIAERLVEVPSPSNPMLEALYNGALALVFPSRFEGFGWPIIEAQACGCPVICSDRDPFPEVAGGAAILCAADDAEAYGRAILALQRTPSRGAALREQGLENVKSYSRHAMVERFVSLYESLRERP